MSMEAEVMRARAVGAIGAAIQAAVAVGKRSISIDEARSLMMAVMRLDLPSSAPRVPLRVEPVVPVIRHEQLQLTDGRSHDGTN